MQFRGLPGRAIRFLRWRLRLLSSPTLLANQLARRWGWPARRLRQLASFGGPPYRRNELHLGRIGALGDVLLCTPALRDLKRVNPACRTTLYTDFPSLVRSLPFIDEVRPGSEVPPNIIWLTYEESTPPQRHIARIMGDHLGLNVGDIRPSCVLNPEQRDRFRVSWRDLPRPWIVLSRHASAWTPNKEWPDHYWEDLIARLTDWATVIEIGRIAHPGFPRHPNRYVDLIEKTTLDEMIAAIAAADLHVGPISGPTHVAAAFEVPGVVIYGGYEHPVGTAYPRNVNLYSPVPCAPCWLRDPCPYDKKCLGQITPAQVEKTLRSLWHDTEAASAARDASTGSREHHPLEAPHSR